MSSILSCPVDCRARVDLGFVLDMSESIVFHSRANWDLVKNFSADIALAFPISPELTRAGVVKFSDTAYLEFHLDAHMQPEELKVGGWLVVMVGWVGVGVGVRVTSHERQAVSLAIRLFVWQLPRIRTKKTSKIDMSVM